jgi:hypothetical protein
MASRGSALSRAVRYFKEADIEEAEYVFARAGAILAERAGVVGEKRGPKPGRKKRVSKANGASEQTQEQAQEAAAR